MGKSPKACSPELMRFWFAILMLLSSTVWLHATAPRLSSILPVGGQLGSELEVSFEGERLQDTEQILTYETGLTILKLNLVTNKLVKAQVKIEPGCELGEHHFRVRTASGLSELMTFFVGPFPVVTETEPNSELQKAQKAELNTTIAGVLVNEDEDWFAVELQKGQGFSAEVEAMRLGRPALATRLAVYAPDGTIVTGADDSWLAM